MNIVDFSCINIELTSINQKTLNKQVKKHVITDKYTFFIPC